MKTISKILSIVLVLSMVLGFTLMAKAANGTATVTISSYADSHNWANETKYTSVQISDDIVAQVTGGANTGKYYSNGEQWRIYQTENPTLKITATGKNIVSVKITYNVNKGGTLTFGGSNVSSGTKVNVNASSVTFGVGNSGSETKGQVRITEIEVVYAEVGAPPCEHPASKLSYDYDSTGHWQECSCGSYSTEKVSHDGNATCVCGYVAPTYVAIADGMYTISAAGKYLASLGTDKTYGYPPSSDNATSNCVYTVENATGNMFYLKDATDRYVYTAGTHKTFQISETKPAEGGLWVVVTEGSNQLLVSLDTNRALQFNSQYNTFQFVDDHSTADAVTFTEYIAPSCVHVDSDSDYLCDNGCGEILAPAADSKLTIEQAIALGTAHAHNSYTSNKYFVSGVVTKVTSTTYGNMQITDGNGHFLTIYGTYGIDGNDRYDAMSTKPGVGDEVVLYGVIGKFNGAAQMKNGWFYDFVIHTCEDDENNHKCDICDKTISEHEDDNKDHVCDNGCSVAIGDHTVDADKDHKCDYCKEIISEHKDDNKDHVCDNGCSVAIGDHTVDTDKDHKCDYCKKALSECKDDNKDHKCDLCSKTLSECKDDNKDHKCDLCTKVISECEFNSADYVTSKDGHAQSCACGKVGEIKAHADADKNGKCDVCEYKVEVPNSGSNNQTNTNNPKDGDAMSIISVVSTMVLSMSGVVALVIKKKSF